LYNLYIYDFYFIIYLLNNFFILYIYSYIYTKVKHRKRSREDKAATSDEDDGSGAQQAAAQVLAKSLPAAAPQEPPAADTPSTKGKKGSANTLRQLGKEFKAPVSVEKAPPRAKRALTGSSSDALV
jgi:hypothetical protein